MLGILSTESRTHLNHFRAIEKSGQTMAEYCREKKIKSAKMRRWKSDLLKLGFIEIKLNPDRNKRFKSVAIPLDPDNNYVMSGTETRLAWWTPDLKTLHRQNLIIVVNEKKA